MQAPSDNKKHRGHGHCERKKLLIEASVASRQDSVCWTRASAVQQIVRLMVANYHDCSMLLGHSPMVVAV